jgi:hypothetical protein
LKCRLDLENDATLVELAEDDGNLSLAVIERVIDQLWRQPEPADNVAVELEHEPRGGGLQVAGHVLQLRQGDAHIDELPRPERVSRIFGRALGRAFGRFVDITHLGAATRGLGGGHCTVSSAGPRAISHHRESEGMRSARARAYRACLFNLGYRA